MTRSTEPPGGVTDTERQACGALYRETIGFVLDALRLAGVYSQQDRDDVAHEIYIRAFRHLHKRRPGVPVQHWIAGFIPRTLRDIRALAHRKRERLAMEDHLESIRDQTPNAEEQIHSMERTSILGRALDMMPDELRMVLILKELKELPMGVVAEAMEVSEATAYRRLIDARESFKKAIKRLSPDEQETIGAHGLVLASFADKAFDAWLADERVTRPLDASPAEQARIWGRLRQSVPWLPPSPAPPPALPPVVPPPNALHLTVKAVRLARQIWGSRAALALIGFLAGGAVKTALDHALLALDAQRIETAFTVVPTASGLLPIESITETTIPSPTSSSTVQPSPPHAATPPPSSKPTAPANERGIDIEIAIINEARRAVRKNDPARALALVKEYAARFPSGHFAKERDEIREEALTLQGHSARTAKASP